MASKPRPMSEVYERLLARKARRKPPIVQDAAYRKAYAAGRKAWVDAVKELNPCADCGEFKPAGQVDFDHLPQYEKLFDIGAQYLLSRQRIITEIAKCEVVCRLCHRKRTRMRQQGVLVGGFARPVVLPLGPTEP